MAIRPSLLPRLRSRSQVGVLGRFGFAAIVAIAIAVAVAGAESPAAAQSSRSPYGRLDPVAVLGPGAVRISGWAIDPDSRAPISVIVSANGRLAGGRAGLVRRDLPRSSRDRGYSFVLTGLRPGPTQVCAGAFNVGPGDPGRLVGCQLVNTGGSDPIANLESVVATGATTARVSGWALDPDTPFPTPADITVDGASVARVVAIAPRPDIERFFPGWTAFHGFSADIEVTEGTRRICVRPQNLGPGRTVDASCRQFTTPDVFPTGSLDVVDVTGGSMTVSGWAFERDQASPPAIAVSFDDPGPEDPVRLTATPDRARPDVGAVLGINQAVGFQLTWTPRRAGPHTVCVAAANRGWGSDRLLGCRTLDVVDGRPLGALELVTAGSNAVTVTGWADDSGGGGPLAVRVTSDRTSSSATGSANQNRSDLGGANPIGDPNVGYSVTLGGLTTSAHRICVEAIDQPGPPAALIGNRTWCGSALVGSKRVGIVDGAESEVAVGPPPASPIADVDRDGGVSARLSDGSLLWLFGDSSAKTADGRLRYFVSGTAAWAAAGSPAVTRDGVEGNRPVTMAVPQSGFPGCPPEQPVAAMWPLSAVVVPDGGVDRVIAWFANMCLGSQPSFRSVGTSVGEWIYDPTNPPVDRAVQFSITNQLLWSDVGPGEAAVVDPSGEIIVYECAGPDQGGWFTLYGPCSAARVDPDDVADPAAYRFWDGSGWTRTRSAAVPLGLPPSGDGGIGTYPPSAFTVTRDAFIGRYVMAYTSWPGFTATSWIRFADSPAGPWSEALRHDIGGCPVTINGSMLSCYAATAQPAGSSAGRLGFGAYRMWLPEQPARGGYRLFGIRITTSG